MIAFDQPFNTNKSTWWREANGSMANESMDKWKYGQMDVWKNGCMGVIVVMRGNKSHTLP